jgi:carbonic anhydrase
MEKLVAGIVKFQEEQFQQQKVLFKNLARGQSPEVLFITCSDSRIDPCLITQTKPGDLFIARNAGNLVPPHYSQATTDMDATIEFAMEVLKVRHIVICGHTDCGAMKGAMNPDSVKHLHHVHNWLANAAAAAAKVRARNKGKEMGHEQLVELIQENVAQQLKHLETHPSVAAALATDSVMLHGWVYDIEHGGIFCYETTTRKYVPVKEHYAHVLAGAFAQVHAHAHSENAA